jgi:tetratricopeptide (TPR) repeat protein
VTENPNNIELIEAYFDGTLSPEEKAEFELRLVYDSVLEEDFQMYKKIRTGFNRIKADQLRNRLRSFDGEIDKQSPNDRGRNSFWLFTGLAASLVIGIIVFRFLQNPADYDPNFIPVEAGLPVKMGLKFDVEFNNAMTAFKAEDFPLASNGFSKLLATSPENDTCLFFLGASLLHQSEFPEAVDTFKKLALQPASAYFEKGQYYMALSLWANGDNEEAESVLKIIAGKAEHPFRQQSKSILDKLD